MAKRNKKGLLSDKIADILSTTPGHADPEDDIYEETAARVTTNDSDEEEIDNNLSKFRKQTVDLLEDVDNRYVGKKVGRKSLKESDEEWETEDEGLSTDEGEALDGVPGTTEFADSDDGDEASEDGEENGDEGSDDDDSEGGDSTADFGDDTIETESDFKHISQTNIPGQMKKGNAVRNQLNVWENLLEIRIQLQKCLLTANKFPQLETYASLNEESEFKSAVKATKTNVSNMIEKFLLLQSLLLKQFGETKSLLKDKKKEEKEEESDEEIPSDTEEEKSEESEEDSEDEATPKKRKKVADFETEISEREKKYKSYRNSTIQKWNDKTRLAVGKSNAGSNTVLQQIEYLLGDKPKLLKRTQLKRSEFEVLGKPKPEKSEDDESKSEEYDTEIYDDTDFYHQLLRELIEVKSGDVTDPVQMSRQWIALQNLRSKMKRKIDTKATKGRKIRYVVHSKLVNFMAPITDRAWTDEAKNELYSSLFGNNQTVS